MSASRAESSSPTRAIRHGTSRSPASRAAQTALPRDELEVPARAADGQRLENAVAADALGQLRERPSGKLRRGCCGLGRMRVVDMYWTRVDRKSLFCWSFMCTAPFS